MTTVLTCVGRAWLVVVAVVFHLKKKRSKRWGMQPTYTDVLKELEQIAQRPIG